MINLFYDSDGTILDAYDAAIPVPEKHSDCACLQVTNDAWKASEGMDNKVIGGKLVSTPIPEPEKTIFTKLAIRRACRALGLESKLNALLEASELFRNDWTDAQNIDLADTVLIQALQAGTFTDAEIQSIKNSLQ